MTDKTDDLCPQCGDRGVRLLYGSPTLDAVDASRRGELLLGGVEPGLGDDALSALHWGWGHLEFLSSLHGDLVEARASAAAQADGSYRTRQVLTSSTPTTVTVAVCPGGQSFLSA
jgi:hypothetical protein